MPRKIPSTTWTPRWTLQQERQFLKLACWFLIARGSLLQGSSVLSGAYFDDCGCYTGMVDNAYEMKLLLEEKK